MKKTALYVLCLMLCLFVLAPIQSLAREGDCGYEGGISSGEAPGKTIYDYQEVSFVTGQPMVFKGTLVIKKSLKQDTLATTYTYSMRNVDRGASLTRVMAYSTKLVKKENGQTVEETSLTGKPSETIKIGSNTYTLKSIDFTRTNLVDPQPSINYYTGNLWGRKTYQMGSTDTATVTVESTGSFYGYDQYWGTAEIQDVAYVIQSEQKKGNAIDRWGGTANVKISTNSSKQLKYLENLPEQISFRGGYLQTQNNSSLLEYSSSLPEFDKNGLSTDRIINSSSTLKLETFPEQKRLPVADLEHLRGYWAEEEINTLFSLEIFKGDGRLFKPEQYMTRAEFTAALVEAAKEVPPDPALTKSSALQRRTTSTAKQAPVVSPFTDVSTGNQYFAQIESAYNRGLIDGVHDKRFLPNDRILLADAVTMLVRSLGLEGMAPNPGAVTSFRDNDSIPGYARNAMYAAEQIGLIEADQKGYIHPGQALTKEKVALLLNAFVNYMRDGIRKDYKDHFLGY